MSYPPIYQSGQAPQAAAIAGAPNLAYNVLGPPHLGQIPIQLPQNSQITPSQTRPRTRVPLPPNVQLPPSLMSTSNINGDGNHAPSTSSHLNANSGSASNKGSQRMSASILRGADVILELIDSERNGATQVLSDMLEQEKKMRQEEIGRRVAAEYKLKKLKMEYENLMKSFMFADLELRKLGKEREKRQDSTTVSGGGMGNEGASSSRINTDNASTDSTMVVFPTQQPTASSQIQSTSFIQSPTSPHSAQTELHQYKASLSRLLDEYQNFRVEASGVVAKARDTIKKLAWEVAVCRAKGRCAEFETTSVQQQTNSYPIDQNLESYSNSSPNMRPKPPLGPAQLQKQLKLLNDEIGSVVSSASSAGSTNLNAARAELVTEQDLRRKRKREMYRERDNEQLLYLQRQQQMVLENANADTNTNTNMDNTMFHSLSTPNNISSAEVDTAVAEALGFPPPATTLPGMNMNVDMEISKTTDGGGTSMSTAVPAPNMGFGETAVVAELRVIADHGGENQSSNSGQTVVEERVGGETERLDRNKGELAIGSNKPPHGVIEVIDVDEWDEKEKEKEKSFSQAVNRPRITEEGDVAAFITSPTGTSTTAVDSLPSTSVSSAAGQLQSNTERGETDLPSMGTGVVHHDLSSRQPIEAEQTVSQTQSLMQPTVLNQTIPTLAHTSSSFEITQSTSPATTNTIMAHPGSNQNNTNVFTPDPSNIQYRLSNKALYSPPKLDRASTSSSATPTTPTTPVTPVTPASATARSERAKAMEAARASINNMRSAAISLRLRGDY